MRVHSYNEWGQLKSVIVGRAENARVPRVDISLKAINYADRAASQPIAVGPYPTRVIEETTEDLERLCETFRSLGVEVLRPQIADTEQVFSNGQWSSEGYYSYCPRDGVLVVGNTIVESPMPLRSRQQETRPLRSIFLEALKSGARWLSAPKPELADCSYSIESVHRDKLTLQEIEPCFDAANILRCGRDLFYLVSNSGNELGALWLQSVLGDRFRVHKIKGVYSFMHLDSTISLLRPGLALLNPSRLNQNNIPEPLKKWEHIWCPNPVDIGYYGPYCHSSEWIGMNLLMVNPQLAIVEENQKQLINDLNQHHIEVIALPLRHARTLGGGFHCVTLDLEREGECEDYGR